MIQKLSEYTVSWNHSKAEPSENKCPKCDGMLYVYTGDPVKEWDMQRGVYNTHQTGETLPCHLCSKDMEDAATEMNKLSYMQSQSSRPKRDNEPDAVYQRRVDRDSRIEAHQRKFVVDMCAAFGITMSQVAEYIDAGRRNQYGKY